MVHFQLNSQVEHAILPFKEKCSDSQYIRSQKENKQAEQLALQWYTF